MKKFHTEFIVLVNGEQHLVGGPDVYGLDTEDAKQYCIDNNLWYLTIVGEVVGEIPYDSNKLFISLKGRI